MMATSPSAVPVAPAGHLSAPASLPSAVVVTGSATLAASSSTSVGRGAPAARGRSVSEWDRHDTM